MFNIVNVRLKQTAKLVLVISVGFLYYFGLHGYLFQSNYSTFEYPLNEDITGYVDLLLAHKTPPRPPINAYNYSYIHYCQYKCVVESDGRLRLVYLVKSAAGNFERREAIRKSWGFERRFSDVEIRTVFVLGATKDEEVQRGINTESKLKGDIVQADFHDNYYNNTIKMMMGIKWAVTYCNHSKLYFFSDDDMYVSTKNVLRFTRNPLNYPEYLQTPVRSVHAEMKRAADSVQVRTLKFVDVDLPDDAELYSGYVFPSSRPHRHLSSKWYTTLAEYPYDKFPPYVTAGSFVLSNLALRKFFYASFYTKHFRFDDIYLGFIAKKLGIVPVHNSEFFFEKKPYTVPGYRYVVASHGFGDPEELETVWSQQKSAGNA